MQGFKIEYLIGIVLVIFVIWLLFNWNNSNEGFISGPNTNWQEIQEEQSQENHQSLGCGIINQHSQPQPYDEFSWEDMNVPGSKPSSPYSDFGGNAGLVSNGQFAENVQQINNEMEQLLGNVNTPIYDRISEGFQVDPPNIDSLKGIVDPSNIDSLKGIVDPQKLNDINNTITNNLSQASEAINQNIDNLKNSLNGNNNNNQTNGWMSPNFWSIISVIILIFIVLYFFFRK